MNDEKLMPMEYESYILEAIVDLKDYKFKEAYKAIMKAINMEPNHPQPQNLLGIWYELTGDNALARKHYRMAYVLDPIYKPASVNLERVSTLLLYKDIAIDFGEQIAEESSKGIVNEKTNETN